MSEATCDYCSMGEEEVDGLTECHMCGNQFCSDCGDTTRGICKECAKEIE
jgi:Prokaryotic RING finger family 2